MQMKQKLYKFLHYQGTKQGHQGQQTTHRQAPTDSETVAVSWFCLEAAKWRCQNVFADQQLTRGSQTMSSSLWL